MSRTSKAPVPEIVADGLQVLTIDDNPVSRCVLPLLALCALLVILATERNRDSVTARQGDQDTHIHIH
eukprot:1259547-Rhodomonas_salina.4